MEFTRSLLGRLRSQRLWPQKTLLPIYSNKTNVNSNADCRILLDGTDTVKRSNKHVHENGT